MKKFTLFLIVASFLVLALLLAACQPEAEENEAAPALANPASTYCQGLGYTEETRENEAGQYGVCIFDDEAECDTWDFLAGRCGSEHSYCAQQGFTLQENGTNIATCLFDDGTSCDELAYFQGTCKAGEK